MIWHESMIQRLDDKTLQRLHWDCCKIRRNTRWEKHGAKHDYIFDHPYGFFIAYHLRVLEEMDKREINFDSRWDKVGFRGETMLPFSDRDIDTITSVVNSVMYLSPVYPEHDNKFLKECKEKWKTIQIES